MFFKIFSHLCKIKGILYTTPEQVEKFQSSTKHHLKHPSSFLSSIHLHPTLKLS